MGSKIRVFFSLLLLLSAHLYSQLTVTEIPVHFGQYVNNSQINPAKACSKAILEVFAGTRRGNSSFSGVSTSAFSAFYRVHSGKNGFNVAGLNFINDNEGPIIKRNRAHILFSRHQKINSKWFFSAGFAIGLYNFTVKANESVEARTSVYSFDGNSGIYLYTTNTRLGISINQFNNAKLQPFEQIIQLNRHYYFIGEHDFIVNKLHKIKPSVFVRYIENNRNVYINNLAFGGTINFLLKDILNFGTSYENNEGFYAFLGIQNINVTKNQNKNNHLLSIDFSYFIPNRNNYRVNTKIIEMILTYSFGKKAIAVDVKNKNEE